MYIRTWAKDETLGTTHRWGGGKREGGHEGDQEESIREKDCTGLVTSSRKTGTEGSPPALSDKGHTRPCQSNFS